jgi:hypothetical protein
MPILTGGDDEEDAIRSPARPPAAAAGAADATTALFMRRARRLMLISGLTTLLAIAAVVGVIGYRVYHAGERTAAPAAAGTFTIVLPKGARVIASAIAGDRIVVTLDVAGTTEIRTFDAKTLKETGRIRFTTEP